jgi:DNA-directed RNA polymerase subunit E'/Rpb7
MVIGKKDNSRKNKDEGIFNVNLLTRRIHVPFQNVGQNLKQLLEKKIKNDIEGKCSVEGYIKPDSTKILSYSSGLCEANKVAFEVVFESLVCCPVEGQLIKCIVKNLTQAGIRAEIGESASPVVIYLSRDHHYNNSNFTNIKENEDITIRVIGQRFELNDEQVSIIGELVDTKQDKHNTYPNNKKQITVKKQPTNKKPKLVIL